MCLLCGSLSWLLIASCSWRYLHWPSMALKQLPNMSTSVLMQIPWSLWSDSLPGKNEDCTLLDNCADIHVYLAKHGIQSCTTLRWNLPIVSLPITISILIVDPKAGPTFSSSASTSYPCIYLPLFLLLWWPTTFPMSIKLLPTFRWWTVTKSENILFYTACA